MKTKIAALAMLGAFAGIARVTDVLTRPEAASARELFSAGDLRLMDKLGVRAETLAHPRPRPTPPKSVPALEDGAPWRPCPSESL